MQKHPLLFTAHFTASEADSRGCMTNCWLIPTLIHFSPQSYFCCACRTILCSFPQGDMLNPAPWTVALSSCWNVIKLQVWAEGITGTALLSTTATSQPAPVGQDLTPDSDPTKSWVSQVLQLAGVSTTSVPGSALRCCCCVCELLKYLSHCHTAP